MVRVLQWQYLFCANFHVLKVIICKLLAFGMYFFSIVPVQSLCNYYALYDFIQCIHFLPLIELIDDDMVVYKIHVVKVKRVQIFHLQVLLHFHCCDETVF